MLAETKINELQVDYDKLINSPFLSMQDVEKQKGVTGVYVIYLDNNIIYIGNTNNFKVRFGLDLKHKSTHTLNRKLLLELGTPENVLEFLRNKCRYRIISCEDKIKAEALEHFAIWVIKPKYNSHIYKRVSPVASS